MLDGVQCLGFETCFCLVLLLHRETEQKEEVELRCERETHGYHQRGNTFWVGHKEECTKMLWPRLLRVMLNYKSRCCSRLVGTC